MLSREHPEDDGPYKLKDGHYELTDFGTRVVNALQKQ
jgi:hypothetical protein